MFRNVIFLGMFVVAASMAGWFSINREGDQTTIKINRSEIRSDASRVISRGREYLDQRQSQFADQQSYPQQSYDDGQYRYETNNRYPTENQYPEDNQYDARRYSDADYDPAGRTYRGPEPQNYQGGIQEARQGARYGAPGSPQRIR